MVSEETWNHVNSLISQRAEIHKKRPGRPSQHLFTGLLYCGCGKKMYVPSKVSSYRCKACSNSITCDDIEAIFMAKLKEWLTPETVAAILLQTDQLVQSRKTLSESLSAQHAKIQTELDDLFTLHREGQIPTHGFKERYDPLYERQGQLMLEMAQIQGELDCFEGELQSEARALEQAKSVLLTLENSDHTLKRQALETLVNEIHVGKEEVVLKLNYLPLSCPVTPTKLQTVRRVGGVRSNPPPHRAAAAMRSSAPWRGRLSARHNRRKSHMCLRVGTKREFGSPQLGRQVVAKRKGTRPEIERVPW